MINYEDVFKQPVDSEAVRREKERHALLYQKIAARNSQGIPAQLPRVSTLIYPIFQSQTDYFNFLVYLVLFKETASVVRARNRHLNL